MSASLAGLGRRLAASKLVRGAGGSIAVAGAEKAFMLAGSVALARLLGPSGFGVYAYAIAVVGFLAIPAQFGLQPLLTREIAANVGRERWDLVHGLLRRGSQILLVATGAVSLTSFAFVWFAPLGLSGQLKWVMSLAIAFLIVTALTQVPSAALMGLREVIRAQWPPAIGRPALFLLGIAVPVVAMEAPLTSVHAMAINVLAALVVLVLLSVMARQSVHRRVQSAPPAFETRAWIAGAVPFAVLSALTTVNGQIDVVVLGAFAAADQVGVYRVALAGAGVVSLAHMAINKAIGPWIAHHHGRDEREAITRIMRAAALGGLLAGVGVLTTFVVWGKPIIVLIYGLDYVAAWVPLLVLSIGMLVNSALGPAGLVLNMTGQERATAFIFGGGAAANVILNLLLVPQFGTVGAATATGLATAGWCVAMTVVLRRRVGLILLPLTSVRRRRAPT